LAAIDINLSHEMEKQVELRLFILNIGTASPEMGGGIYLDIYAH
jgi:hypothetical protein